MRPDPTDDFLSRRDYYFLSGMYLWCMYVVILIIIRIVRMYVFISILARIALYNLSISHFANNSRCFSFSSSGVVIVRKIINLTAVRMI